MGIKTRIYKPDNDEFKLKAVEAALDGKGKLFMMEFDETTNCWCGIRMLSDETKLTLVEYALDGWDIDYDVDNDRFLLFKPTGNHSFTFKQVRFSSVVDSTI